MKKSIYYIFLALWLNTQVSAQTYTYNRCSFDGSILKSKGEIFISDSLISIFQESMGGIKESKSNYPVIPKLITQNFKQLNLKTDGKESDYEVRFTFQEYLENKKNEKFVLVLETKDKFKSITSTIVYFLIPKQIN